MAAALCTVVFIGRSGRRYSVSGYASDSSAVLIKFDEAKAAVAGSPDYYTTKEDGVLSDVCFTTDLATPTHVMVMRDGTPTGDILDVTAQLASVVYRPSPAVPYPAGAKIQIMQL